MFSSMRATRSLIAPISSWIWLRLCMTQDISGLEDETGGFFDELLDERLLPVSALSFRSLVIFVDLQPFPKVSRGEAEIV